MLTYPPLKNNLLKNFLTSSSIVEVAQLDAWEQKPGSPWSVLQDSWHLITAQEANISENLKCQAIFSSFLHYDNCTVRAIGKLKLAFYSIQQYTYEKKSKKFPDWLCLIKSDQLIFCHRKILQLRFFTSLQFFKIAMILSIC